MPIKAQNLLKEDFVADTSEYEIKARSVTSIVLYCVVLDWISQGEYCTMMSTSTRSPSESVRDMPDGD